MAIGCSRREMQEYKSERYRGLLDVSSGSADTDCWSGRVDVDTRAPLAR